MSWEASKEFWNDSYIPGKQGVFVLYLFHITGYSYVSI